MYTSRYMRSPKFLLSFALIAGAAFAQGDRGTIAGTVSDPFGAIVPRATVQAKNVQTGTVTKAMATSSATGTYSLADLPAGAYEISVAVPGLRGFQQSNVRVDAAKTASLDIRLQEGTQLSTLGEDTLAIAADQKRHAPPSGPHAPYR